MQKIEIVIFDIDGTLANTLPLIIKSLRQVIEPLVKHSFTDEEIEASFGPNEEGTIRKLAPDADAKKLTADFLQVYKSLFDTMCPAPFEGIETLLQNLQSKGVKLAISTGKGKESTEFSLSQWKLNSFFEMIENGTPEDSRKTEAIPHILSSLGNLPKGATVYIGDSPGDIKDSKKAGIIAVAAAWAPTAKPEKLKEEQPDEIFHTVADFADWLNSRI